MSQDGPGLEALLDDVQRGVHDPGEGLRHAPLSTYVAVGPRTRLSSGTIRLAASYPPKYAADAKGMPTTTAPKPR